MDGDPEADAGRAATRARTRRTDLVWIGLLLGVAALLRLPGLDGGLWIDEIFTLLDFARRSLVEITTGFSTNNNHPLHSVLAHLAIRLFGEHAWSLRLPAFLFGVASVPLVYLLGLRVTTRREALLAAAFAAVSYHHVWFSQNARGYTALLVFTLLSTVWLLRALEEQRASAFVAYGVSAALGAYTHLTMGFVIAGQGLVTAWLWLRPGRERRPLLRQVALGFGVAAALSLAAYLPMLEDAQKFFAKTSSEWRKAATLGWALRELAQGVGFGLGVSLVAGVGGAVGGIGVWSYLRQRPAVVGLFLLPGVLTTVGAVAMNRPVFPRFYFFLMGFALLIGIRGLFVSCAGLARLAGRSGLGVPLATGLAGVGLVLSLATVPRAWGPKQDFAGALAHAESREREGARVAVVGIARIPFWRQLDKTWPEVASLEALHALESEGAPLLLVYTFPAYIEAGAPELMREIDARCAPERVFHGTVGGGDIVVCRMTAAPGAIARPARGGYAGRVPAVTAGEGRSSARSGGGGA